MEAAGKLHEIIVTDQDNTFEVRDHRLQKCMLTIILACKHKCFKMFSNFVDSILSNTH
jgi:hypothetical protein